MSEKRWPMLLSFVFLLLILSGSLFITVSVARLPQDASVELLKLDYEPRTVCPGDRVGYTIKWELKRPSVLILTPTHNQGLDGTGNVVVVARSDDVVRINKVSAGIVFDDDPSFTIPNLPSGEYARVLSIGTVSESSEPVFVTFPYTIPAEGCGDSRD